MLIAGLGALLITAGAFAAGGHHKKATGHHKKAAPETKVHVTVHTWEVSISGHTQKAIVGGTVKYSPNAPVESITPVVHLTAEREGKNTYSYRVKGPHNEETGVTEGTFSGTSTTLDPPIVPLALTLGPEGDPRGENATFTPGKYELEVRVGSPQHLSFYGEGRGKPALVVTLKLVRG
jgi:hypothetical protein